MILVRLGTRVALVTAALVYLSPYISGIKFHGNLWGALLASCVFNAAFFGLECILGVIVFGINIGTLGLGVFISSTLKFVACLVAPSLALIGTAKVMPNVLHVSNYFPGALVYGLALGGVLWASFPEKAKDG